jgi:hypothetical protein
MRLCSPATLYIDLKAPPAALLYAGASIVGDSCICDNVTMSSCLSICLWLYSPLLDLGRFFFLVS